MLILPYEGTYTFRNVKTGRPGHEKEVRQEAFSRPRSSKLLEAFGIKDATDKLCDLAGIERPTWTDETIEEINRS